MLQPELILFEQADQFVACNNVGSSLVFGAILETKFTTEKISGPIRTPSATDVSNRRMCISFLQRWRPIALV